MPTNVAHEILQLAVYRGHEWLWAEDALPQLQHFGGELIPGLVECLTDADPDVRRVAIGVLALSRPDADFSVPQIIERLGDSDRLVRLEALRRLSREFGPLTADAIPFLEMWLDRDDEYERIHALVGIVTADPNRRELLPEIWNATQSDHPCIREIALAFIGIGHKSAM